MQNPDGTAAAAAVQQQLHSQRAVLRLTQQAVQGSPTSAPTSRLTKLGKEDNVEA